MSTRNVAVVGFAHAPHVRRTDGTTNGVEMLMPCFAQLYQDLGITKADIGFWCSGSSDYLAGRAFSFISAIDSIGAVPPINESHVEMDAAWALFEAYIKILTGEVDAAFVTPHIVVGLQKAGNVKILGAASLQRMAIIPDVPTFTEQGINGFVGGNWYGVVAPRGIPDAIKQRLARELQRIAASPVFVAHTKAIGVDIEYLDATGFAGFLTKENERWGSLVKSRNIEIP